MRFNIPLLFFCLINVSCFAAGSSSSSSSSSNAARAALEAAVKKDEKQAVSNKSSAACAVENEKEDKAEKFRGTPVPRKGLAVFEEPRQRYRMGPLELDPNLQTMVLDYLQDYSEFDEEPAYIIPTGCENGVLSFLVSDDGQQLLCMQAGTLEVRERDNNGRFPDQPTYTMNIPDNAASIALSSNSQNLFVVDDNGMIGVYEKKDNRFMQPLVYTINTRLKTWWGNSILVSKDGQQLIKVTAKDGASSIDVYAKEKDGRFSNRMLYRIPTSEGSAEIALSADGNWLFALFISVIEVREKGKDGRFPLRPTYIINPEMSPGGHIGGIALSNNGQLLFSGLLSSRSEYQEIEIREKQANGRFSNEPRLKIKVRNAGLFWVAVSKYGELFTLDDDSINVEVRLIDQRKQLLKTNNVQRARLIEDKKREDEILKRRRMKKENEERHKKQGQHKKTDDEKFKEEVKKTEEELLKKVDELRKELEALKKK